MSEPCLRLTEPKLTAASLATGGHLVSVERSPVDGRLVFTVSGAPEDFVMRVANDEVQVSVKRFITAMETVLNLISEHKRGRR